MVLRQSDGHGVSPGTAKDHDFANEAVKRTREAVEAAKARHETQFSFSNLYWTWDNIKLEPDEKDELKRRLAEEGWETEDIALRLGTCYGA